MATLNDNSASNPGAYLSTLESINKSSFDNDGERNKALLAAYALVSRLETPWETLCRIAMGQPGLGASLKILRDVKLLERWHEQGDVAMTYEQLAELVSCDAMLIRRLLRDLGANNLLEEVSPGKYKQTPFTLALLEPKFGEWISFLYDLSLPLFYKMPEYIAQTRYTNPTDEKNGVFQYTKGFKGGLYDYHVTQPREAQSFNQAMGGIMGDQASWTEVYPHETLVNSAAANDSPILVDMGGGLGHDLEHFRAHHPHVADRLYLQDRRDVVALSKCPDPVHKMAHDLFTPQPVRGARAYYLHNIFHNWPDEPCRKILEMLKPAMTPGYSTVLVHDHILPESNANPQMTAYDDMMIVLFSSHERTESMWRALLKSAGFKVIKIWGSPNMVMNIIEAEPIDASS